MISIVKGSGYMNLPIIFNSMQNVLIELQINELLQFNDESKKYGLILSEEDAKEIIEVRNEVLQSYGRIELDIGVTKRFIQEFSASTLISQEEYAETLNDLNEVFYYIKNETEDKIGDDELIDKIKDFFENYCEGSLELLKGRELEEYARKVRRENQVADYLLEGEMH